MLNSLKKSVLSFSAMLPMIFGVVGLVAMLQTLVPAQRLVGFFTGNAFVDTLIGTGCGAVAAGNPMVSYVLGGEMLGHGVSLYAVTAFILAWVTLGVIQLPMEVEAFGRRFTLIRNLMAFLGTLAVATLTTWTVGWWQ